MIRVLAKQPGHRRAGVSTATVLGSIAVLVLVLGAGFLIGRGASGLRYDGEAVAPAGAAPDGTTAKTTPGGPGSAAPGSAPGPAGSAVAMRPAPAGSTANPPEKPDASGSRGAPPITFDPVEIDFGTVLPDTDMKGTFRITNVGDETLTVQAVKPDCKCTTVGDIVGRTIAPGETVETSALMEGPAAGGNKRASVAIVMQGYSPAVMRLRAHIGRVVTVEPYAITATRELAGELVLTATDGRPFNILASNSAPPTYVDGFVPGRDEPRTSYTIGYDLSRFDQQNCFDQEGNRMPVWWIIETDHPEAPIVDLQVRQVPCSLPEPLNGRNWVLSKQRVILGKLHAGEPTEFSVYLKWLRDHAPDDTIREVRSESDQFDAELIAATREGDKITCRVKITPHEGYEGLLKGDARFFGFLAGRSQALKVIGIVEPAATRHAAR